jgi:two-component system OmpR family response regulator
VKILMIESDPIVGRDLMQSLRRERYCVDWARSVATVDVGGICDAYALIILDANIGRADRFAFLGRLRSRGCMAPVIVTSSRMEFEDLVLSLDVGADDFLVRPIKTEELLARSRALVRRSAGSASPVIDSGRVKVNINDYRLTFEDRSGILSAKEYALVMALMQRPGLVLSREQLEERLYGWGRQAESNAVDVIIYGIRRKFGSSVIQNIRGIGWRIAGEISSACHHERAVRHDFIPLTETTNLALVT